MAYCDVLKPSQIGILHWVFQSDYAVDQSSRATTHRLLISQDLHGDGHCIHIILKFFTGYRHVIFKKEIHTERKENRKQ